MIEGQPSVERVANSTPAQNIPQLSLLTRFALQHGSNISPESLTQADVDEHFHFLSGIIESAEKTRPYLTTRVGRHADGLRSIFEYVKNGRGRETIMADLRIHAIDYYRGVDFLHRRLDDVYQAHLRNSDGTSDMFQEGDLPNDLTKLHEARIAPDWAVACYMWRDMGSEWTTEAFGIQLSNKLFSELLKKSEIILSLPPEPPAETFPHTPAEFPPPTLFIDPPPVKLAPKILSEQRKTLKSTPRVSRQPRIKPVGATDLPTLKGWPTGAGGPELLTAEEEVELAKTIEVGVFARKRLERAQANGNSKVMEGAASVQELKKLVQIGDEAFYKFLVSNVGLVNKILNMSKARSLMAITGIPLNKQTMSDLAHHMIYNTNAGLWRAVVGFDYKKGYKFSVYAWNWLQWRGLYDAIAEHADIGLTGKELASVMMLRRLDNDPANGLDDETRGWPRKFHYTPERYRQMLFLARTPGHMNMRSLDARVEGTDHSSPSLGAFIADTAVGDKLTGSAETYVDPELRFLLEQTIKSLTPQEQAVIRNEFGLSDNEAEAIQDEHRLKDLKPQNKEKLLKNAIKRLEGFMVEQA